MYDDYERINGVIVGKMTFIKQYDEKFASLETKMPLNWARVTAIEDTLTDMGINICCDYLPLVKRQILLDWIHGV